MNTIHQRLLVIIKEQNLSIASFERKIGVGRNSISMALRKNSAIDHQVIKKINETFPMYSISWIVCGEKESPSDLSEDFCKEVVQLFKKWENKL